MSSRHLLALCLASLLAACPQEAQRSAGPMAPPDAASMQREGANPGAPGREVAQGSDQPGGRQDALEGVTADWTSGVASRQPPEVEASIRLDQVRVAAQKGFDRVVFDFAGEVLPGYRIEFVQPPLHKCGSGAPTRVAGAALLQVHLQRSQAHTEEGKATAEPRERSLAHPVVRELELTCDFEGEVIWVLGLERPSRYRVLELSAPTRLVVDVAH